MNLGEKISIKQIEALVNTNPLVQNFVRKFLVSTYEEFVELLYDDLDAIIAHFERNPQRFEKDSEDEITYQIVGMLNMRSYNASHGETSGGNTDLIVKGGDQNWTWIGEAKIFKAIDNLREGFLQLSTRYRNSNPNHACGGILAYIKRNFAADHMADWREDIRSMDLPDFSESPCNRRGPLAFYTTHKHKATGLPFKVRHNGICLHHEPDDKSGKKSRKRKTALGKK